MRIRINNKHCVLQLEEMFKEKTWMTTYIKWLKISAFACMTNADECRRQICYYATIYHLSLSLFTYTVGLFKRSFLHLEQTFFFFISTRDMWIRRFFSKYMLWMGDVPKFLEMTWKAPQINPSVIFFKTNLPSNSTAGMYSLNATSGIHPSFNPKENYTFVFPLPEAACCCWQSCWYKQELELISMLQSWVIPTSIHVLHCGWLSRKDSYWEEHVWRCAPDEVIARKFGKAAASDGRRVITQAHEGAVSSVWQSSPNSGLIHHMGIMLLTGRTPQEILYQVQPIFRKPKQSHPPSGHTLRLVGMREDKRAGVFDGKKKITFALDYIPQQSTPFLFSEKWLCCCYSCFIFSSPNNFGILS